MEIWGKVFSDRGYAQSSMTSTLVPQKTWGSLGHVKSSGSGFICSYLRGQVLQARVGRAGVLVTSHSAQLSSTTEKSLIQKYKLDQH